MSAGDARPEDILRFLQQHAQSADDNDAGADGVDPISIRPAQEKDLRAICTLFAHGMLEHVPAAQRALLLSAPVIGPIAVSFLLGIYAINEEQYLWFLPCFIVQLTLLFYSRFYAADKIEKYVLACIKRTAAEGGDLKWDGMRATYKFDEASSTTPRGVFFVAVDRSNISAGPQFERVVGCIGLEPAIDGASVAEPDSPNRPIAASTNASVADDALRQRRGRSTPGGAASSSASSVEYMGRLRRMSVMELSRGRGIGRRLVEAVEAHARSVGMRAIMLSTSHLSTHALTLYAKRGFVEVGRVWEWRRAMWHITLRKSLGSDAPLPASDSVESKAHKSD